VLLPPDVLKDATLGRTIPQLLGTYPILSTLYGAAGTAGTAGSQSVASVLGGAGPFTLFAPTNDAFTSFKGALPSAAADLGSVLTYHALSGKVLAAAAVTVAGHTADATPDNSETTVNLGKLRLTLRNGGVVLNETTKVVATDLEVKNGVVHLLDSVLVPTVSAGDETIKFPGTAVDFVSSYPLFSSLATAVVNNGLTTALTPVATAPLTIFAPNDYSGWPDDLSASTALQNTLKAHVVAGALPAASLTTNVTNLFGGALTPASAAVSLADPTGLTVADNDCSVKTTADALRADIKVNCDAADTAETCVIHVIDKILGACVN